MQIYFFENYGSLLVPIILVSQMLNIWCQLIIVCIIRISEKPDVGGDYQCFLMYEISLLH